MEVFSKTRCFFPTFPSSTSPLSSLSSSSLSSSLVRTTSTLVTVLLLAVSILSLSPSASAEPCTPTFEDDVNRTKTEFVVREGINFTMRCRLSNFNTIKWTINGREITEELQKDWDINITRKPRIENGIQLTELTVLNATKVHNGEYKCASVCSSDTEDANVGIKVTVSIAINITLNGKAIIEGNSYRKFAAKDKPTDLVCTAKVPGAQMTWSRIKNGKEEDMKDACAKKDIPGKGDSKMNPPAHCTLHLSEGWDSEKGVSTTVLKLSFRRLSKEPNVTLDTLSDFATYTCRAKSEGNQDGSATMDLLEMNERFKRSTNGYDDSSILERDRKINNETVSANRFFGKGKSSVTVVEGDELYVYCDIHGVTQGELEDSKIKVIWLKDGLPMNLTSKTNATAKFLRSGFIYKMAEREHRGTYTCKIQGKDSGKDPEFSYYVRVKDKLGALWPFLAICGEVVVLCTIILIYEQRRNKAELEESDTDGSPDQKNSNDDAD